MDAAERQLRLAGGIVAVIGVGFTAASLVPGALEPLTSFALGAEATLGLAGRVYAAIAGGLMAGLGVSIARAAGVVAGKLDALRPLVDGLVVWFVVDSAGSLALGAWRNVLGNAAFLALGLVPLAAGRRALAGSRSTGHRSVAHASGA